MTAMVDQPSTQRDATAVALAHELKGFGGKLRRRLLEQADAGDLTPSQSAVLLRLEKDGPATSSGLARAERMRPQSMGVVVAVLEAAGLVAGAPDPADGRQTILSLTEGCRTWLAHGRAAREDWLARIIEARLTPHEQDELAAVMPLLRRLVED